MDGRERDFRDAIVEACAPFDVKVDFARGSKHPYAKIALPCGKTLKSYYPGSTSDRRSVLNNKSQVKRMLKKNDAPLKPAPQISNGAKLGTLGEVFIESFKKHPTSYIPCTSEPELPFMKPETTSPVPPVQLIRNGAVVPEKKSAPVVTASTEPKYAKLSRDEAIQLTRLLSKNADVEKDIVTFAEGWDDERLHKILASTPGREKISLKTVTDFRREHFGMTQAEIEEKARRNQPAAYLSKGLEARFAEMDVKLAAMQAMIDQLRKDLGA